MRKVVDGERPGRPEGAKGVWFTDDLWGVMNLCWVAQPGNRPNVGVVLDCLGEVSGAWRPSAQVEETVVETDEDDWALTMSEDEPTKSGPKRSKKRVRDSTDASVVVAKRRNIGKA